MDVFPKFIIETDDLEGDVIIIAKCTFHKQLATDINKVKGGGAWRLNKENMTFTLFGKSHDFGEANIEDIKQCIKNKKVFSSNALVNNLTNTFKFEYINEFGETIRIDL